MRKTNTSSGLTRAQEEARAELRGILRPGDKVYCVVRKVSGSGMSRNIDFYLFLPGKGRSERAKRDVTMLYLSYTIAQALGLSLAKAADQGGIVVKGTGMDMGAHVVRSLSSALSIPLHTHWI
jgi:hypothetical protein